METKVERYFKCEIWEKSFFSSDQNKNRHLNTLSIHCKTSNCILVGAYQLMEMLIPISAHTIGRSKYRF